MAMPEHLRRVRERIGNDVLVLPSVMMAVFDAEGRLLVVRESDSGLWVIPGGCVDPDEVPADCAAREMWEETGLEIEPVRVLGVYGGPEFHIVYRNGDHVSFVGTLFLCRIVGGSLRADGDEVLEARFATRAEVDSLPLKPWMRLVLPGIWDHGREARFQPALWRRLTGNRG